MKNKLTKYVIRILAGLLGILTIAVTLFLFLYIFWKGKNVMSLSFILDKPAGVPLGTAGGIYPALMGSIYLGALSALMGGIIGIGVAVYLVFYTRKSIFYHVISACITEKILKEKGTEYMKNSLALGMSREYAVIRLILPVCTVELLGTVALGMAYGMGAVAPILYTGAVMVADVPGKLTDPFMSLPYHLYMLVNNGFSLDYAYGTAFVLMLFLLLIQIICKCITYIRKDY